MTVAVFGDQGLLHRGAPAIAAGPSRSGADGDILLTGFEPFGAGRPPNPSWEGIRTYDDTAWRGYRITCRRIPVDWEAPLAELRRFIADRTPVAVVSLGQGLPGKFAIETVAHNARGGGADNKGERARNARIVEGGPDSLRASVDASKIARELQKRGYEVVVSEDAGSYLCEEMLYSLEYLRREAMPDATVLFCHVPPLGTRLGDKVVDVKLIEAFVGDLLDVSIPQSTSAKEPGGTADGSAAARADDAGVRKLVDTYFASWSRRDLARYGECFDPGAVVQLIDGRGRLDTIALDRFLASQRSAHARAVDRLVERPVDVNVAFSGDLSRVDVYWRLFSDGDVVTGFDHFTLRRSGGEWRIVHLIYYAIE